MDRQVPKQEPEWQQYMPEEESEAYEPEADHVPTEIRTQLPLPKNPKVKLAYGLGLAICGLILLWAGGQYFFSQHRVPREVKAPLQDSEAKLSAEDELKLRKAMGDFKDLDAQIAKQQEKKRRDKLTDPAAKAAAKQRLVARSRQPSIPQPPIPQRPLPRPPLTTSLHPTVPPVSTPAPHPTPVNSPSLPSSLDPFALLAQASNAGVYGAPNRTSSKKTASRPGHTQLVSDTHIVDETTVFTADPNKAIPVTTRIPATVSTAISWVGNKTDQQFRITTTEDAKSADGTVVIPKNTLLLAQVKESNIAGYVEIQIISAQIDGREKKIPAQAILVQGTNGSPLKVDVKKEGGSNNNGLVQTLTSALPSSVGDNLLTDTAYQAGVNQIKNATRGRSSQQTYILVLKQGIKLDLFVNQPFSL
jgi:hypothetical protein